MLLIDWYSPLPLALLFIPTTNFETTWGGGSKSIKFFHHHRIFPLTLFVDLRREEKSSKTGRGIDNMIAWCVLYAKNVKSITFLLTRKSDSSVNLAELTTLNLDKHISWSGGKNHLIWKLRVRILVGVDLTWIPLLKWHGF